MKRKLLLFVITTIVLVPLMGMAAALTVQTVQEQVTTTEAASMDRVAIAIASMLSISIPGIAAGLAISSAGNRGN